MDRAQGLERKIERLKVIADRLEEKGKTEQAAKLREKIKRAEEQLAQKKKKIEAESEGGDDSGEDSEDSDSDDDSNNETEGGENA